MKNQELIDKRFSQIEGKLKTLKLLISHQTTVDEFRKEIEATEEIVNDLKSLIEREASPLRYG